MGCHCGLKACKEKENKRKTTAKMELFIFLKESGASMQDALQIDKKCPTLWEILDEE